MPSGERSLMCAISGVVTVAGNNMNACGYYISHRRRWLLEKYEMSTASSSVGYKQTHSRVQYNLSIRIPDSFSMCERDEGTKNRAKYTISHRSSTHLPCNPKVPTRMRTGQVLKKTHPDRTRPRTEGNGGAVTLFSAIHISLSNKSIKWGVLPKADLSSYWRFKGDL